MHAPATIQELFTRLSGKYPEQVLIQKVAAQLNRDFTRAGLTLSLKSGTHPSAYIDSVLSTLQTLSEPEIRKLVYLIDIPERLTLTLQNTPEYFEQLAEIIVYREFVKVYYQLMYQP